MVNKYYFTVENDGQREKLLKSLHKLKNSPGWKAIKRHFEEAKKDIEEQIFSTNGDYNPQYNQSDLLKKQRELIMEFIGIPEEFINLCEDDLQPSLTEMLDPYDKSLLNRSSGPPVSPESIDGVAL